MKTIKALMVVGLGSMAAMAALADEAAPAWQAPDYVIEEIVVTAPRPASPPPERVQSDALPPRPQIHELCL